MKDRADQERRMMTLHSMIEQLQQHWAGYGESTPTLFPGTVLDASSLEEWYEFWVTQIDEQPQRVPRNRLFSVAIDVHCYCRGADKRQVHRLADEARNRLAQRVLMFPAVDSTMVISRSLRIREGVCRDLTRDQGTEHRLPLQHLVISFQATAEQVAQDSLS